MKLDQSGSKEDGFDNEAEPLRLNAAGQALFRAYQEREYHSRGENQNSVGTGLWVHEESSQIKEIGTLFEEHISTSFRDLDENDVALEGMSQEMFSVKGTIASATKPNRRMHTINFQSVSNLQDKVGGNEKISNFGELVLKLGGLTSGEN